jgi:hypothetical protein
MFALESPMEQSPTPVPDDQLRVSPVEFLATKRQLESALARIVELEARLEEATLWAERAIEDVVDRDQRIRQHTAQLTAMEAEHGQRELELNQELQAANLQIATVYQTRAWRAMTIYWRFRDGLRGLLGRGAAPR